ncbi:MAG: hypothetical protein DWI48_00840 [Chloroflexi bacterium]|nr:MAG: hypothetical protein DWI48_00840 [Chloroflexota bacterium]
MISSILLGLLFGAVPIGVIAGVIGAAVAARDARDEPAEPGIGTVRRLFVYVLALVGLVFAAIGVSLLVSGALQVAFESVLVSQRSEALSTALAFTLVGTPAWVVFAYLAQRSVAQHLVEAASQARRLYFVVVRGVALVFVVFNAIGVGKQLVGVEPLSSHGWGWLVAWGGVWLIHDRFVANEPTTTAMTRLLERLYLAFGTVLGLMVLLIGINSVVVAPVNSAYEQLGATRLVDSALLFGLRDGVVVLVVGALVWAWHWLLHLARERGTTLWHVVVFVFGTLPGVALTVVPVAVLLYTTLTWFLGTRDVSGAHAHFHEVPALLGALVTGVATWGYHRAVLVESMRGNEAQSEPERVYRYLVAAAGLLTAAIGIATLLALACEGIAGAGNSLVRSAGWWRNPLLRAVTLLAIGAPLWAWYWGQLQRVVTREGAVARASLSRRAFVFAAVGVSLIALLISLVVLLFQVLRPLLDGDASLAVLRDARWSIATVATSAFVTMYYLLVMREDQAALRDTPAPERARTREVTVIASADTADELVVALRRIDGVRVRSWQRTDSSHRELSGAQIEMVRAGVAIADAEHIAVIVNDDGVEVVPFREA